MKVKKVKIMRTKIKIKPQKISLNNRDSSFVKAIDYSNGTISVQIGINTYHYHCPADYFLSVLATIKDTDSLGKTFNRTIKGKLQLI